MTSVAGLRARLREGRPLLVTFVIVPRVEIVEAAAVAGFDGVVLDQEHGPIGIGDLPPLLAAAHGAGLAAVVRVPECRPKAIEAALDAGADGVLVPHVGTAEDAARAVAAARFAPEGSRGVNPWVRAARYGRDEAAYLASANASAAVIAMIEGLEGTRDAEEIVATPGLDGVFVGPYDLSAALGKPGRIDDPDVRERIDGIAARAREAGVAAAVFTPSPPAAPEWIERGFRLVALSVDAKMILEGFRAAVSQARPAGRRPPPAARG